MNLRTEPSDVNWNLLRTFCVIAEEGGITAAARRLRMSQPSVSLALQRLEEQLGCQLVFRGSRHFALTRRGEGVYQECADILRSEGGAGRERKPERSSRAKLWGTPAKLVAPCASKRAQKPGSATESSFRISAWPVARCELMTDMP